MTKKEILNRLIALEKKYTWLTADQIGQEELFEIQEEIGTLMLHLGNETQTNLAAEIPYLFKATTKSGESK